MEYIILVLLVVTIVGMFFNKSIKIEINHTMRHSADYKDLTPRERHAYEPMSEQVPVKQEDIDKDQTSDDVTKQSLDAVLSSIHEMMGVNTSGNND